MELLMRAAWECLLVLCCCLSIATAITAPTGLGLASGNTLPVARYVSSEDNYLKGNAWNYPKFSIPLEERQSETKRRSSFIPVRGRKTYQIVPHGNYEDYLLSPKTTIPDETASFPLENRIEAQNLLGIVSSNSNGERYPNEQQSSLENGPLNSMGAINWPQLQKRPSAFMAMRGKKRYVSGNSIQLLRQDLPATVLDLPYKNSFLTKAGSKDSWQVDPLRNNDQTNYLFGKTEEGDSNFPYEGQIGKHMKSVKGHSRPVSIENGTVMREGSALSRGKVFPAKRALSFVPTRGRREKSDTGHPPAYLPLVTVTQASVGREEFPTVEQVTKNVSPYAYDVEEKAHLRHRRASAFMPMRGRKSDGDPSWLTNNYLPQNVGQMQDFFDRERINSVESMDQQLSEAGVMRSQVYAEDYPGSRREKKKL